MLFKKKKKTKSQIAEKIKKSLREDGKEIFQKYKIEKVSAFGSVYSSKLQSTAEVAVLAVPLEVDEFWSFRQDMGVVAGCPVDVFSQDDEPDFLLKVQEQGELIYDRQKSSL
jgi:predicted nucleotidyltransferase